MLLVQAAGVLQLVTNMNYQKEKEKHANSTTVKTARMWLVLDRNFVPRYGGRAG
jgi:hypothetical protein